MRRLALLAAALAVACSSSSDGGDKTPPAAPTITAPAQGAIVVAADLVDGKVAFVGTAEAGATVEVQVDGAAAGSAVASPAGDWSAFATVANGSHTAQARAIDAAGNASAFCAAVSFTVNATVPAVPVILLPQEGAALAASDLVAGLVVFSGTADAAVTVEIFLDGVPAGSTVAAAGGAWAVAADVADGNHAVRARARDADGNASALGTAVSFSLDATAPAEPVVLAPRQGAFLGAADLVAGEVVFSGTAEPSITVEVQLDGAPVATTVALADGAWSAAVGVTEGPHAIRARALDAVANPSTLSPAVSFTVDTSSPAAPVITAPQDGATLVWTDLVNGQVVVSGTADGATTVLVQVDGLDAGAGLIGGGAFSIGVTLASGLHTVRARATDAAGNASPFSAGVTFSVDTTRLALPIPAGSPVPVTSWAQSVPVTAADVSGLGALFPGQANSWVLDPSFSLATGFGLQYVNALLLYTGTPSAPTSHGSLTDDLLANAFSEFLGNQAASEVVFLTPAFGAADGVETAAASDGVGVWLPPPISGTTSAYLSGTSDSRLSRTLALEAGQTYTFSWMHEAILLAGSLAGAPAASYQVVLRDPATGAVLGAPLFTSSTSVARGPVSATRSGLPASVVLSFELRSAASGYVQLDDVALASGGVPVALANGNFEAGLSGWLANSGAESQNVRSGARTVGPPGSALRVTRTFYAPPSAPWGRMVDVFENTGTAEVITTAIYVTTLGAVAGVVPCAAISEPGAAIAWDCSGTVRDVGLVFGSGTAHVAGGDPFVFVTHDLAVAPGAKVALVHFVVQLGEAAGGPTSQPVDVPWATATQAAAILTGFRTLEPYRADLEPGVIELVTNL